MSDDPTPLSLPSHLPYPITITRLVAPLQSTVTRGTKLLEYTFTSDTARRAISRRAEGKIVDREDERAAEGDMVGSWESPVEGELLKWGHGVQAGLRIEKRHASRPVVYVQQPCTHPVQLHGLCGVCGKELNEHDYLSQRPAVENIAGPSRFPGSYEMGHDSLGVTVSSTEAKRLDTQTRVNLLRSRRLSLIVDLDQTIIHTTVDPTVGEWLQEVEDAKVGRSKRRNPNTEALADVASFHLEDDLPPGAGRSRISDRRYYTKPRPGLPAFLEAMSDIYEMHVYTMGTRTYANAICKVIDPDGKIFGGRILSRDESGSFSSKNLKRLFPTDQSMVVVIDDRSDVWGDIPNLVKVIPYDFFIGIGDINSNLTPSALKSMNLAAMPTVTAGSTSPSIESESSASTPPPMTPPDLDPDPHAAADEAVRKSQMMDRLEQARPLQHLQDELDHQQRDCSSGAEINAKSDEGPKKEEEQVDDAGATKRGPVKRTTTPEGSPPPQIPLLNPHDGELIRLTKILTEIHSSYYAAYDAGQSSPDQDELPMGCDVELIIPDMKSRVLDGCNLVFSGIIPRHIKAEQSEIWQLAQNFGALPALDVTPQTTHCVTATIGTEKTHKAQRMGKWVVKVEWFSQCVAQWRKVDEAEYDCYPALKQDQGNGYAMLVGEGTSTPSGLEEPAGGLLSLGDDPEDLMIDARENGNGNGAEGEAGALEGADEGDVDIGILDDPDFQQGGWDEAADAEMAAFFAESDDGASDRGSIASPPSSIPGTPRKRVRYADEEDLPLMTFRDPPIKRPSFDVSAGAGESQDGREVSGQGEGSGSESPPRRRKTPYMLPAPPAHTVGDEEIRRMELSEKQKERLRKQIEEGSASQPGLDTVDSHRESEVDAESQYETDGEGEDEFARMLAQSLDDG